jgi:chemotaxis protein methyltransferase CheR
MIQIPDTRTAEDKEIVDLELGLLLEAVYHRSGYDFRQYAPSTIRRRIKEHLQNENVKSVSILQDRVLHDPASMERLIVTLSVRVTSMFRDPEFYRAVRTRLVPFLKTFPFIRIWHAGCCTGEEVYSLAILLHEEGIYGRCRIYATDMNAAVIKKARDGVLPMNKMQENSRNYIESGGQTSLSDYYTAAYEMARLDPALIRNAVFAQHNLATDNSFNEFNLIFCRNVMIYFNLMLQKRAHRLFYQSLCRLGFLCLGNRESLKFTTYEDLYRQVATAQKIYQKIT